MRRSPPRALLITDPAAPRRGLAAVSAACASGAASSLVVMHRDKQAPTRALLRDARRLRAMTRAAGARFIVNGRLDIALAVGADGVHLPASGHAATDVRACWPDALIGVSCHDGPSLVERTGGADYATISPVFATPGKGPALGVEALRALGRTSPVPLVALGGMNATRAREVAPHVAGVAAIRAFSDAADGARVLAELLRARHASR